MTNDKLVINLKPDAEDLTVRTRQWLETKSNYLGAQAVIRLLDSPDTKIPVLDISLGLFKGSGRSRQKHSTTQTWGDPIPMIDDKTRRDCMKEANKLIARIAVTRELGNEELAGKLQRDLDLLKKYLRETTMPGGKIKNFPDKSDREYQRIYQAINTILKKARAESPEVHAYLERHIKTGKTFAWVTRGLRKRGRKIRHRQHLS